MSYISLHRHQPWHKSSYLSLGGLADDALRRFLSEYPDIRKIVFCLDNDTDKLFLGPGRRAEVFPELR